jgi:hypothetical protein
VLHEDFSLAQVVVADWLGIVEQPAFEVDGTFGNRGWFDSLGRQRPTPGEVSAARSRPPLPSL